MNPIIYLYQPAMRKFLLLLFILVSITTVKLHAQSCFSVAAGNDTTISCLQTCLDLKARIPDVRTTEDYQVVSIPYSPFPYINATGIEFNPVYIDDEFSSVITLPFTFCYYGQNYSRCVVGTNGVLTFDLSNANAYNDFVIPPGVLIPNTTYPRAIIMGPFHDIDPQNGQQPYNRRMEYIIEGTAPCRKFVLNFYRIPYFGCDSFNIVTQQMILYEGTGIIDMFLDRKPIACGGSTNNGRAIMGIQNWDQDKARWVPNRNNTVWAATREGWRFVPSGTTSLLDSVSIYKNGVWIKSGTTVSLGNGELEATFPNICQPEDSMSYVIRAFYRQCDNPVVQTEGSDTIIVYKALDPVTANLVDPLCNGSIGNITVTAPVGANIEYSINGGVTWQASPTFNVGPGTYTVLARLIGSPCISSRTFTITAPPVLNALSNIVSSSCAAKDGSITITASGGTPAYQYSIDNGVTYQASNQFLNLASGNYNVRVKDANNCLAISSAVISLNDTMRLDLGTDSTICFGSSIILLPQTNPQTDTFRWTPSAGLNYDTAKNPIASPNDTTKYYLLAKWGICQRIDSITINILHKPVANAGKDTTVCYKTNALLVGNASNLSGTVNYLWSPPDSLNTPNAASTIARIDTTRKFTLTVTDNYGCNFTVNDSMWVYMMPPLVVHAGNDTNAILGRPHQLLGSGGTNYVWSPAGPLNNPFIARPLATLYNDTWFTVVVTDSIGCTSSDGVFIKVYEGPMYYVPNAFTPNGDGLNDVFRPIPVGIQSTTSFRVFNRFGELMFQTNKWLEGWDGMYKGKKALGGTYTWMIKGIDKNGKVVEMSGTVILIQ